MWPTSQSVPAIYFYDKEGNLIGPESVVDVMGDLMVTEYGALTLQSELPPLAELTIATHGRGDLITGSVKVVSDGPDSPIGGILRFDLPDIGVARGGASQPVRTPSSRLAAKRKEFSTAAAIRNLDRVRVGDDLPIDTRGRSAGRGGDPS